MAKDDEKDRGPSHGSSRGKYNRRGMDVRSMMASYELDRLGVNPIEKLLGCVAELDELIKMNVDSFKSMRGFMEKGDSGTQYLANAIRGTQEKASIYTTLARFKHPTLSAVAMKDVTDNSHQKEPMTTAEAITVLKNDPFASDSLKATSTEKIIEAMTIPREAPLLMPGKKL